MTTKPVPKAPILEIAPGVNEDSPVRDLLQRCVQTELSLETTDVIVKLVEIVESVDAYSCYVGDTQRKIGDAVFKHEGVRDLLLNITSSLKMNLLFASPPIHWPNVLSVLVNGHPQPALGNAAQNLLMPAEGARQLTSGTPIDQILIANEWFATFMLLRIWLVDFSSWAREILEAKNTQMHQSA